MIFDNKIKVLLIENKNITTTGCTLTVNIGFMYDTINGIAHFLEHMLFMGSKKYPKENEFSEYISSIGGMYNAFTSYDRTAYHFICNTEYFSKVFDIFINFFIEPLFNESSISREINAVDAEHNKNIGIDIWRLERLIELAGKKPLKNFHTGSEKTLNVKNIRGYLVDFFEKYYSSNIMNIVIFSSKPIEEIEEIIKTSKLIKNKNIKPEIFGQLYETPKLVRFNTISKNKFLSIIWNYCYSNEDLLCNIPNYVLKMLESESSGTLLNILKKNELINDSIITTEVKYNGSILIKINLQLTNSGKEKINEIVNTLFDYIDKIRKNDKIEKYYNQFRNVNNYKFLFSDNQNSLEYLIDLSILLSMNVPIESLLLLLSECYIYEYDKKIGLLIQKMLDFLTIENAIILISTENEKMTEIDENYNLRYIIYKKKKKNNNKKTIFKVSIPKINPFVVNKISIKNKLLNVPTTILVPKKICDIPTIYFKNHGILPLPFTVVECFAISNWFYENVKNNIISKMFIVCMFKQLESFLYDLKMSIYNVSFGIYKNTFSIIVYGNSEKISKVLLTLIKNLCNPIDKKIFENTRKYMINELRNFKYEPAYEKIKNYFISSFDEIEFSINDKIQELHFITYDEVNSFTTKLKKYIKSELNIYIQGNIEEKEASSIGKIFTSLFNDNTIQYKNIQTLRKVNSKKIILINENKNDVNYDILYCCPIGYINYKKLEWKKNICCFDIIYDIVNEKFFNKLRTKEQLGYIVKCQKISLGNKQYPFKMFGFMIQSPDTPPEKLIEHIEKFIVSCYEDIKKLTDDDIVKNKFGKIKELENEFTTNTEEIEYFSNIIIKKILNFNIKEEIKETLNLITKDDVISFYEKYILSTIDKIIPYILCISPISI